MSDQTDQGAGAVPAPTAPTADAAPAPTTAAATDDAPTMNHRELVELKKDVRTLLKRLDETRGHEPAPKPPTKPAQDQSPDGGLASRLDALERRNALVEAYADYGVRPGDVREAIEAAVQYAPADKIRDIVSRMAKLSPAQAAAAAAPAPVARPAAVPPPAAPSKPTAGDTGAPGQDGRTPITTDLAAIDPAVYRALPVAERKRLMEGAMSVGGRGRSPMLPAGFDPFARAKARGG